MLSPRINTRLGGRKKATRIPVTWSIGAADYQFSQPSRLTSEHEALYHQITQSHNMYACMYYCTHTYTTHPTHTHTHTHIHTYAHTHTHTYTRMYTCMHTHMCTRAHTISTESPTTCARKRNIVISKRRETVLPFVLVNWRGVPTHLSSVRHLLQKRTAKKEFSSLTHSESSRGLVSCQRQHELPGTRVCTLYTKLL